MTNHDMRNMQDHHPHRNDQIEAWIKDRRDQQELYYGKEWHALDALLDEYREAADTGRSLEEVVNGVQEPEPTTPHRKSKISTLPTHQQRSYFGRSCPGRMEKGGRTHECDLPIGHNTRHMCGVCEERFD